MEQLGNILSYILLQRRTIAIKQLGRFELQCTIAHLDKLTNEYTPTTYSIDFQSAPLITATDSYLIEYVAQILGLDSDQAQRWIDEQILSLKWSLIDQGEYPLYPIGKLIYNLQDESIELESHSCPLFVSSQYGLSTLEIPTTKVAKSKKKKENLMDKTKANHSGLRRVMILTPLICLLTIVLYPSAIRQINIRADYAGLLPTIGITYIKQAQRSSQLSRHYMDSVAHAGIREDSILRARQQQPLMHYVILDVLPKTSVANDYSELLQAQGYKRAGVLQTRTYNYIYLAAFKNKSLAESYIQRHQNDSLSKKIILLSLPR